MPTAQFNLMETMDPHHTDNRTEEAPVWPWWRETTEDATAAPPPPPSPATEVNAPKNRPTRLWAVAVVAALVGAGVGGGVAVGTRGHNTTTITRPSSVTTAAAAGNGKPAPEVNSGSDVRAVLAKVEPAVVTITTNSGAGTGMIITADGEVLTNAHVVGNAQTVKVTLFKENSARTADVLSVGNPNTGPDVALVKIRNASGLPTVTLGNSDNVQVGDDVVAIGNALNLAGGPTVTKGIVSATDRSLPDSGNSDTYVQTDAAINPGNSGGPLVLGDGSVIGMNTLVIQQAGQGESAQNLGFAIAVNEIKPLIASMEKGGNVANNGNGAFLGVATETLTPDIASQLGVNVDSGALVDDVTDGQPAADAGLQRGDVIVSFNGKPVTSSAQLRTLIGAQHAGDKATVEYVRGNDKHSATVTLAQRPSNP